MTCCMSVSVSQRDLPAVFLPGLGWKLATVSSDDMWLFVCRNPPGFAFLVFKDKYDCERAVRKCHGRWVSGQSFILWLELNLCMTWWCTHIQSASIILNILEEFVAEEWEWSLPDHLMIVPQEMVSGEALQAKVYLEVAIPPMTEVSDAGSLHS